MKKTKIILLFGIIILGSVLRFWGNEVNPPSLNIDEVAIGYNAFSILETGKDEYGESFPLHFKSVGDYKPPILIYLTSISVGLFGLTEFAVRFPTAFISSIGLFFFYFLYKIFFKTEKIALLATLFTAISPWHIYYSRYASEAVVGLTFLVIGYVSLLYWIKSNKTINALISILFLTLSIYTYHSERLFIPLLVMFTVILNRKVFVSRLKISFVYLILFTLVNLPIYYSFLYGFASTRASMTFVANDIDFIRSVLPSGGSEGAIGMFYKPVLLFFFVLQRFLNYLHPRFLFSTGLGMTTPGSLGMGVMYLFEIPLLLYGVYSIVRTKLEHKLMLAFWLILAILPAALAQNAQHPLRSLQLLPALVGISAFGGISLYTHIKKQEKKMFKYIILIGYSGFIIWNLLYASFVFRYYFPYQRSEAFMHGSKEAVSYIRDNYDSYDKIVFDPRRGVVAGDIVSIPHMYILFYTKYDPTKYQNEEKREGNNFYGFDKYEIRNIDWPIDGSSKNTLFVGSPWNIPVESLKPEQILAKIYLQNGDLAYVVATSKE